MGKGTHGIHHITAIAGDAQVNLNFYANLLGLRFVKKTINFDDPGTYHLYYGNESGNPGTILTFFPWLNNAPRGKPGNGQVAVFSFSVPENSFAYWAERLKRHQIDFSGPCIRFDEELMSFHDPDGIEVELVASATDQRAAWEGGPVPPEYSIHGFNSALLCEDRLERTAELMTNTLGFRMVRESGARFRFESGDGGPGTIVDILCKPAGVLGQMGVGTVHHIAWRTKDDETQRVLRVELVRADLNVTPVIDRKYFHSIYFREPGNVLFEVATDPPGFTVDESLENLGTALMLPPWLEEERETLQRILPLLKPPMMQRVG